MSEALARSLYGDLVRHRLAEEKLVEIYALGKVPGHIHSGIGEEAAFVGTLSTRREGDYFKLSHRNVSASTLLGVPLNTFFAEAMGRADGNAGGLGGINHICELSKGLIGFSGTLGCDIPIAVGAALTLKSRDGDNLVYAYLGEGTFSRGPVHEALNLAAVWRLPILFVCENNQFAISTPVAQQSPVTNPGAGRAAAYGMPARIADGTDVFAVREACAALTDDIRGGGGPAILEVESYRMRGHFEGDQAPYRDPAVTEEWRGRDCLEKLEATIRANGWMTDPEMRAVREAGAEAIDRAVAFAEASPPPRPEDMLRRLYAGQPTGGKGE